MKIVSNINGNTKTTSYGNKLFYRSSPNGNYTQVKRAFYRSSPNANYTQVYLYDNVAPTITVTSSTANTPNSYYTLTATITDNYSGIASITINDVNYPVTYGSSTVNVSKSYNLVDGNNSFVIKAVDAADNVTTVTANVYKVKIPSGFTTNWQTYVCFGEESANYHPYDTFSSDTNTLVVDLPNLFTWGFQHPTEQFVGARARIPNGASLITFTRAATGPADGGDHGFYARPGKGHVYIYNDSGVQVATLLEDESAWGYNTIQNYTLNHVFDISAYNNGAYFIECYSGYGNAGAQWANCQSTTTCSFS